MHGNLERGQERTTGYLLREFLEVQLRGFSQVGQCFFNRLALSRCAGLRVQSNEPAFGRGSEYSG